MVRTRHSPLPLGYPARDATTYRGFRDALAASACTLCPLSAARAHIVVDRGDPTARVMAIGEAPGAEEDRSGRAFVGRAGRLLDDLLVESGLDPDHDVLIANVVKCRPPGNRPPHAEEARRCLPFLRRQIELVRPRILLLLGRTALKHMLPGEPPQRLALLVGKFFRRPEYAGIDLMVLFHPAYVLRYPASRPVMVRGLVTLRKRIAEVVREGIGYN